MFQRLSTALLATAILAGCGQAEEQSKSIDEVRAAEAAFYEAFLQADEDAFYNILADDFTYQHGSGIDFTEASFVDFITSGAARVTRADTPSLTFKDYGDTIVTYGMGPVEGLAGETAFGGILRFVNVWTLDDSTWRLSHRNSEFLPE